jgi:hypothetical protein
MYVCMYESTYSVGREVHPEYQSDYGVHTAQGPNGTKSRTKQVLDAVFLHLLTPGRGSAGQKVTPSPLVGSPVLAQQGPAGCCRLQPHCLNVGGTKLLLPPVSRKTQEQL